MLIKNNLEKVFQFLAVIVVFLLTGCLERQGPVAEPFLLRVENLSVTESEFNRALEIAKTAYSHNMLRKSQVLRKIKLRLLSQMAEELVIRKVADENGIAVSDAELKQSVAEIRKDYPAGEFEQVLLENAVDYKVWEERLKSRLLMEKVVEQMLASNIVITPGEMAEYYDKKYRSGLSGVVPEEKSDKIYALLVKRLRSEKIRESYSGWIEKIKAHYSIEVNEKLWEKVLGEEAGSG